MLGDTDDLVEQLNDNELNLTGPSSRVEAVGVFSWACSSPSMLWEQKDRQKHRHGKRAQSGCGVIEDVFFRSPLLCCDGEKPFV